MERSTHSLCHTIRHTIDIDVEPSLTSRSEQTPNLMPLAVGNLGLSLYANRLGWGYIRTDRVRTDDLQRKRVPRIGTLEDRSITRTTHPDTRQQRGETAMHDRRGGNQFSRVPGVNMACSSVHSIGTFGDTRAPCNPAAHLDADIRWSATFDVGYYIKRLVEYPLGAQDLRWSRCHGSDWGV